MEHDTWQHLGHSHHTEESRAVGRGKESDVGVVLQQSQRAPLFEEVVQV